jgi:hypothetical protein
MAESVSFYIKFPAEATKQVLAALTVGLFTPNGIRNVES